MKCILVPNTRHPFNLTQIWPNPDFYKTMTEQEVLDRVIWRNKEVGLIPCETAAEQDQILADFAERHPDLPLIELPSVGPHYIVDEVELPGEFDYFFNAGEWDNGPSINISKARGLQMDKIRKVRNKELANLDVPFMKALEDGDTDSQATVKTKKQILRDIPQTFDLTTENNSPEELKQKWPEGLSKE